MILSELFLVGACHFANSSFVEIVSTVEEAWVTENSHGALFFFKFLIGHRLQPKFYSCVHLFKVRTGPGNPGKSLKFQKSFSRHGKSWKSKLGYIFFKDKCPEVFNQIKHCQICQCKLPDFPTKVFQCIFPAVTDLSFAIIMSFL